MSTALKRQWGIPLIASYVGSVYLYTIFTSTDETILMTIYMLVVIATFLYSLYVIWKNYLSKERTQLFKQLALFAIVLHGVVIPVNYFLQGIIAFTIALIMIYFFFNRFL